MSNWKGAYVCHVCRKCECAFVAEDYTNAKDIPPKWRLCPDCAKETGIDYDSQKPSDYWTEEQRERYKKSGERLKTFRELRKKKLNLC
jgi:hypothetical protein